MKKDIEWLKEEFRKLEKSGVIDSWVYRDLWMMANQLDEPETLSFDWIDVNKKDSGVHYIGYYVPIGRLHDLLVPKQELPVIPQFVADFIESYDGDFYSLLYDADNISSDASLVTEEYYELGNWLSVNSDELLQAVANGYEVEEEQKYIIEVSDGLYLSQPLGDTSNNEIIMTWSKEQAYKFKDEESIESHLLKFKGSMAEPVEEVEK